VEHRADRRIQARRPLWNWLMIALVALATIAGGIALGLSLAAQREGTLAVRTSSEKIVALRSVLRLSLDAETGARGFLLTEDNRFLEPYEASLRDLPPYFQRLEDWGLASPNSRLHLMLDARRASLAQIVALARDGRRDEAIAFVRTTIGQQQQDAVRAEIARLEVPQQAEIDRALAGFEVITRQTNMILAFLALIALGAGALGLRLALRSTRLEAKARRLREVERAEKETALIARELDHRVKNLFAVVLAIIQLGGRGATSAADAIARIKGRVEALSRAHDVSLGRGTDMAVDIGTLVRATLAPYAQAKVNLVTEGPQVDLPVMRVNPIGMILHELATNAAKYGAWAAHEGVVTVRWNVLEGAKSEEGRGLHTLRLTWDEETEGGISEPTTKGFGSRMIESVVAQLGGRLARNWKPGGLSIVLDAEIVEAQAAVGMGTRLAERAGEKLETA